MRPRRVPSAILLPLELSWKVVVLSCFGVGFQRSFLLAVIATGLPLCLGVAWVRVCTLFGLRGRRKASESEQCDDVFAPLSDRFRLFGGRSHVVAEGCLAVQADGHPSVSARVLLSV